MPQRRATERLFSSRVRRQLRLDTDLIFNAHLRVGVVARALTAFVLPFALDLVAYRCELRHHRGRPIRDAHVVRPEARTDRPHPFTDWHLLESRGEGGAKVARHQIS